MWVKTKVLLSSFVFIFMRLVNERTDVRLCFHKSIRFCSTQFFVLLFELSDKEKAEYYEVVFGVVRFTENVRQYDGYRE